MKQKLKRARIGRKRLCFEDIDSHLVCRHVRSVGSISRDPGQKEVGRGKLDPEFEFQMFIHTSSRASSSTVSHSGDGPRNVEEHVELKTAALPDYVTQCLVEAPVLLIPLLWSLNAARLIAAKGDIWNTRVELQLTS